jgi:hypothetical protein
MIRTNEEIIKETQWRKYGETDCKAVFYAGKGYGRIDFVIQGETVHQEVILDVYPGEK